MVVEETSKWLSVYADMMSKPNINKVHYRKGFTEATMATTQAIAWWCYRNKLDFITEVKMKKINNTTKRPDVVIPGLETQVVEIRDSETYDNYLKNKVPWYTYAGITCIELPANPVRAIKLLAEANGLKDFLLAEDFKFP